MTIRGKYNSQQLDEKIITTFKKLFESGRYDTDKIHSLADMLSFSRCIGVTAQKKYLAIEALLAAENILEVQMKSSDTWTFSVYQTLRHIEQKEYDKRRIYTSLAGKTNAMAVITQLNDVLPDWLDAAGKIRKPR